MLITPSVVVFILRCATVCQAHHVRMRTLFGVLHFNHHLHTIHCAHALECELNLDLEMPSPAQNYVICWKLSFHHTPFHWCATTLSSLTMNPSNVQFSRCNNPECHKGCGLFISSVTSANPMLQLAAIKCLVCQCYGAQHIKQDEVSILHSPWSYRIPFWCIRVVYSISGKLGKLVLVWSFYLLTPVHFLFYLI